MSLSERLFVTIKSQCSAGQRVGPGHGVGDPHMDMVLGGGSSRSTGRRSGQVAVFVHLHAASSTRRFQFPQTSASSVISLAGLQPQGGWVYMFCFQVTVLCIDGRGSVSGYGKRWVPSQHLGGAPCSCARSWAWGAWEALAEAAGARLLTPCP